MSAEERYRLIRSHMVRINLTNVSICREAKVSREYLFQVMKGYKKGYRVRQLLADRIGVSVGALFPDNN